jgi:Tfp pilus assembly protein PilF
MPSVACFRLARRKRQLDAPGDAAMIARAGRHLVALAFLFLLAGCGTSANLGDLSNASGAATQDAVPISDDPATTDSVKSSVEPQPRAAAKPSVADAAKHDIALGKKYFAGGNFNAAERHFRRATESDPGAIEAWLGLAACHDNMRRFDLADQDYERATKVSGVSAEILNNWGYSYMLRGDRARAREILLKARAQDPGNPYVKNNLELLEASVAKNKSVQ